MFYTGHGDAGYTTVIGGPALPKCHARIEALGALDEAQAQLGVVRATLSNGPLAQNIRRVQQDLYTVMADIALPSHGKRAISRITTSHLQQLEEDIAAWEATTGGFAGFTVPGESLADAYLHLARTVVRRAERALVALDQYGPLDNPLVLTYLNRLSSWLYALTLITYEIPAHDAA